MVVAVFDTNSSDPPKDLIVIAIFDCHLFVVCDTRVLSSHRLLDFDLMYSPASRATFDSHISLNIWKPVIFGISDIVEALKTKIIRCGCVFHTAALNDYLLEFGLE